MMVMVRIVTFNATACQAHVALDATRQIAAVSAMHKIAMMTIPADHPRFPNLPRALLDSGHSQADVSRALRVSRTTVSRWLQGTGEPDTVEKLQKLADYLNVTIAYLVGEEDAVRNDRERQFLRKLREADPSIQAAVEAVLNAAASHKP